ncbi:hypothetical protein SAMN02745174_02226 [Cetobacterium ceti]|uniref:Uncharacterized protein n=1 Tax=Cetobacterium ceti TaxID=180163 RepID=A0A1T4Q8X5_9FUSO|nr:hypothetical protein [Cetobacterium ceti]SJZ99971.1 hypothetical protein SAMN02745174_02226 [Cetobacterium ceti]
MDILKFTQEHQEIIITAGGFILGLFFTKIKARVWGQKVALKLPRKAAIELANYLDAFKQGLLDASVNGNKNIASNDQVTEGFKKLEVNLGLDKKLKGKTSL